MFQISLKNIFLWRTAMLIFFVLPGAVISGCAGGDFGRLQRNYELTRQFETYQVAPDYRYYYTGSARKPLAILGLQRDLELITDYWHEIAMTPEQLRNFIENLAPWEFRRRGYFGYYIVNPDGRRLGVWYSLQDHTVVRTGPADNTIEVYRPDMDIEERANRPFGAGFLLGTP